MFTRPNPASGVPIYLQLMRQIAYAIEIGALRTGDQLPGIRALAAKLAINPNTVAKAYRELGREGTLELRQGAGVFVTSRAVDAVDGRVAGARALVERLFDILSAAELEENEIRRLFEAEIARRFGTDNVLIEFAGRPWKA